MRSAILTLALMTALTRASFAGDEKKAAQPTPAPRITPTLLVTLSVQARIASLAFDSKGEKLVTVGWDTRGGKSNDFEAWKKGTNRGDIRIWKLDGGAEIARFGDDCGGL